LLEVAVRDFGLRYFIAISPDHNLSWAKATLTRVPETLDLLFAFKFDGNVLGKTLV
jgi:hypothetical protein